MNALIIAAAMVLPATVQNAPPALNVELPALVGASADPTCGNQPALARQAFCLVTTQAAMQGLADQYDAAFRAQGWMAADGSANITVYVRRRETGGCDGFQLYAFADDTRASGPAAPGYFAFSAIPGNVCTTTDGQ